MLKRLMLPLVILALAAALFTGLTMTAVGANITINAKALTDHECNNDEWHFVITQVANEGLAPPTIHVEWTNGNDEDVPLDAFTGSVAHYVTTDNLDSTVESASATIYNSWDGQFNLSHGPCNEVTTTTTSTTTTTTTTPTVTTAAAPTTTTAPVSSSISVVTAQPKFTG